MDLRLEIPTKLRFLLEPHRYKVAWGGRNGTKSWAFARALLLLGLQSRLRILCTREIQRSIKDSVHKLLSDQIELLKISEFYVITQTEIRGLNGTEFLFSGLSDQTSGSLKSYEGVTHCWVEEAQGVTKQSWDILIPTIRAPGSEIWISFNPLLDTDETYQRFVVAPPPGAVVAHVTYRDNPWMTAEAEAERLHCLQTQPDDYDNIWEGLCAVAIPGAIFAREVAEMLKSGRIGMVPYDPRLKVHTVWDMGWNDHMSIGLWQRGLSDVRAIGYLEGSFRRTDEWVADLVALRLNWGYDFLPHDAFHVARQTGKTDAGVLQAFGRRVKPVPNLQDAEQARIRALRQLFPRIYADKEKCAGLIECWKRYRRNIPKHGEPSTPIHDEYSHGCDMSGYMALVVHEMTNEDDSARMPSLPAFSVTDRSMGVLG